MLAIERRKAIFEKLQEEKRVVVSELSAFFEVTDETIRRDLEHLEAEGLAKKTYGGAILNESLNLEVPFSLRRKANVGGKLTIADIIGNMISDGDSIMLDSSTTAVFIAKSIKRKKNMTVITNSLQVLMELSDRRGWNLISTGGIMRDNSLGLTGFQTVSAIESFNVDMAIFSVNGIDLEHGMTDANENIAHVKMAMMKSAKKKILVVDSSKFNIVSFTRVGKLSDIDVIVTDTVPSKEWVDKLYGDGVELICHN